jgi:hypothetical protein
MIENFFSAGALIVKRLQDTVQSVPNLNIRLAPNQEWAIANALDQSIHVIFFDDQPDTSKNGSGFKGSPQISTQYWLVVVSLKNVSNVGSAARHDVGGLLVAALKTLQGFKLSPDHTPLTRQRSPFRNPDKGGYVHIPLMFTTSIII